MLNTPVLLLFLQAFQKVFKAPKQNIGGTTVLYENVLKAEKTNNYYFNFSDDILGTWLIVLSGATSIQFWIYFPIMK